MRREYPCDHPDVATGKHPCPFEDERGEVMGNCRDNCGLGVDEDSDPADDYKEEENMVDHKCVGPACGRYDAEGGNGYCSYKKYDVDPDEDCDYTVKPYVKLDWHTTIGGYNLVYLISGDVYCPECAERQVNAGAEATATTLWEGPSTYCGACGKELPTEYGDPDSLEDIDNVPERSPWVQFLGEMFHCYPCPVTGNMPCDSGTYCDQCRAPGVDEQYKEWRRAQEE